MAGEPPATTTSHIPPFAKPLAPYIKSRQEALRIRQVLTSHLRSHITFAEEDLDRPNPHAESHLALCAPQDAVVDVERISPDVTGLRKEYLEALQANVAARRAYESISENVTSKTQQKKTPLSDPDPNSNLQAYLVLLRDRRRHAKLQVFQHYLQQLKTRQVAEPEDFDKTEDHNQHLRRIGEFEEGGLNDPGTEDSVEGLVHKLERAVIRARAQLEREKKLLAELKAQQESNSQRRSGHVSQSVKVQALQRTRDALVQWVEEKLVSVGANDEGPMEELSPEEIEDAANLLDERKTQIGQQYGNYVEARRILLETAAKACQPIAAGPANQRQASIDQGKPTTEETPSLDPLDVVSFASELLLPLSTSQRALALHKSYLSGMLSKEKSTTLRILNRMSDESHLLPEYPILARQPRFKHAAAAINSRQSITAKEQAPPEEITTLAEAWAFAAGAAREHEQEYVAQKVVEGGETAEEALQMLEEICGTLNQDLEEIFPSGQEESHAPDIWASEAQSRTRTSRTEKRPKGPLSGLDGRVGITE